MNVVTFLFLRMILWCFLGAMTLHAKSEPVKGDAYFAAGVENRITKVYYHKGPLVHEIVLYCAQQPIINHIPDSELTKLAGQIQNPVAERYRFFMPYTSVDLNKFKETLHQLGQQDGYSITLKLTNQPLKGLECVIQIDPSKIGFQVETFETMKGDKAVAFKCLQRENLHRVNHKSHPLIRTAQASASVKKNFMLS